MKKISVELVQEIGDYVTKVPEEKLSNNIVFHNLDHARYVVEGVEYIGKNSSLSDDEFNILKLCVWFHDAGFIINPENHEKEGRRFATEFLTAKGIDTDINIQVRHMIMSTCMPQHPKDLISQVLYDADLKHLAGDNYFDLIDNLQLERIKLTGEKLGKRKLYQMFVKFFQKHNYHTDNANQKLQQKRKRI